MSTKFMSDNSLSELVAKIKSGFIPVKSIPFSYLEPIDLNNYTSAGIYIINGLTVYNIPGSAVSGTKIGCLAVLPTSYGATQFWMDKAVFDTDFDYSIFCRQKIGSSWSVWVQIPTETELTTELAKKLNTSSFTLSNITGTLSIAKGGTGATNKSTALANLVYNTVASGDSTDLNSYTTQAVNCFTSTVPAASNIPTGSSGVGMLAVVTSDRTDLYQVWFEMSSGKTDMFMRTRISGTWSSWGKVYNTNDDSGFINPSLAGVGSEVSNCFVSKKAGFVNVTGYVRAVPTSTTASTVTTATVPEGYRPTRDAVTSFCVNESVSPNTLHAVQIATNGNINIRNVVKTTASNQVFRLNITYPSDF